MIQKIYAIDRGLARRFADGNDPMSMLARLLEEAGELAQQVQHFEGRGVKREKYGEPDRQKLAKEVMQVVGSALAIAAYYGIEKELEKTVESFYQRVKDEGWIE